MLWVLIERVGSAGGNSGRAGSCKHMQTSPDWMLGAPPCCWAHLVGIWGEEKTYLGSCILINIYPALSATIRGRDGMDCSGALWMTRSNYRTHHQSWLSRRFLTVGCIWWGFWVGKNVFRLYYTNKTLFCNLFGSWWAGQDGLQWGTLDDVFYKRTRHQSRRLVVCPCCWGHWVLFVATTYVYLGS